jgi:thymidylate synthase
MEDLFLKYDTSLELKELGFDEPCFAGYNFKDGRTGEFTYPSAKEPNTTSNARVYHKDKKIIGAPTFSQAFRWFRKKYKLEGVTQQAEDFIWYKWKISQYNEDGKKYVADWYEYKTYEEAELECLKQLIEIVKEKK